MKNVKNFSLFEKVSNLSDDDKQRLERIEKNSDNWIKEFENFASKGKADRFMDHYNVVEYIMEEPDAMASVLTKLLNSSAFNEWLADADKENEFPESFRDSMGIASDLKRLGF